MKKSKKGKQQKQKQRKSFNQIYDDLIEKKRNKNNNNESVGDYNSRFGTTSTWSGDAGWMDD